VEDGGREVLAAGAKQWRIYEGRGWEAGGAAWRRRGRWRRPAGAASVG
jgi:hypothetical protein